MDMQRMEKFSVSTGCDAEHVYKNEGQTTPDHLSSNMKFTAVVLAGARSDGDPVASIYGETYKALVPVQGVPMVKRVVEALQNAACIGRVIIVFDAIDQLKEACPDLLDNHHSVPVQVLPCKETICCSVGAAIEEAGFGQPVLVTTADHALLTPRMVETFCEGARDGASLSIGFVERDQIELEHPGSKRTYLSFKGAALSGANLFAFADDGAVTVLDFWRKVESQRKKPWKLFKAFGYGNLFGLLFRRYTVDEAFRRASKVLGVETSAICLPQAEAAIDVDTPKDYHQVSQILALRKSAIAEPGTTEGQVSLV